MKNKNKIKNERFKTFYALSLAWQLGLIVTLSIGGSLYLGYSLDKSMGTSPLMIIIMLIVGIIITTFVIYHLLAPIIKD